MKRQKVVVTGGAGFIGSHLAKALCDRGCEVHIIDRDPSYRRASLDSRATLHVFDVRDRSALGAIFTGADAIFHLAASAIVQNSIDHPIETTDNNVMGTVSVLDAAAKAHVRRVVYSSSSAAYGEHADSCLKEGMQEEPISPYGLQKWVGELYMQTWSRVYGLETISLRYFNVYGPGLDPHGAYARVMGLFIRQRLEGVPLTVTGDGMQTRDFVHVSDVVRANILAADSSRVGRGEVINIGSGLNTSILQIAKMVGGEIKYLPARLEPHDTLASIEHAHELLGWRPEIGLREGIAELRESFGLK